MDYRVDNLTVETNKVSPSTALFTEYARRIEEKLKKDGKLNDSEVKKNA